MASTIRELCRKEYQFVVRTMEMPEELRRALKSHERVPLFIDNLAREFGKLTFQAKKETIVQAVHDMTKLFIVGVRANAEAMQMSSLERARLEREAEKAERMKKDVETFDEKGFAHVLTESESCEEIRKELGLKTEELRDSVSTGATENVQTPRKSDAL